MKFSGGILWAKGRFQSIFRVVCCYDTSFTPQDSLKSQIFTKSIALAFTDYVKYIANGLFKLFMQVCTAEEVCRQFGARSQLRRRYLSK